MIKHTILNYILTKDKKKNISYFFVGLGKQNPIFKKKYIYIFLDIFSRIKTKDNISRNKTIVLIIYTVPFKSLGLVFVIFLKGKKKQ